MGYYSHFSSFLGEKHSKLTWKFRIKIYIPILFNISVLLDVQANLPETSPFFCLPKWLWWAYFFNWLYVVLRMYNFVCCFNIQDYCLFLYIFCSKRSSFSTVLIVCTINNHSHLSVKNRLNAKSKGRIV